MLGTVAYNSVGQPFKKGPSHAIWPSVIDSSACHCHVVGTPAEPHRRMRRSFQHRLTWGSESRSEERLKKWPWKVEMRSPLEQRIRITACTTTAHRTLCLNYSTAAHCTCSL